MSNTRFIIILTEIVNGSVNTTIYCFKTKRDADIFSECKYTECKEKLKYNKLYQYQIEDRKIVSSDYMAYATCFDYNLNMYITSTKNFDNSSDALNWTLVYENLYIIDCSGVINFK